MAYVHSSFATGSNNTLVSEITVPLSANDSGDLAIVVIGSKHTSATWQQKTGTTGWTLHNNTDTGTHIFAIFYKFVGASEANPTFEEAAAGTGYTNAVVTVIKGAHATPIITFSSTQAAESMRFNIPTVDTTGYNDSLILHAGVSSGFRGLGYTPLVNFNASYTANANNIQAGWFQQQTGGVTPAIDILHDYNDSYTLGQCVIAIRDDGTGAIRGHIKPTAQPAELVQGLHWNHYSQSNEFSTGTNLIPTLDGNATNYKGLSNNTNSFSNIGDYPNIANHTSNANTPDATAVTLYDSTKDLSDCLLQITMGPTTYDSSLPWDQGGRYFGVVTGADVGASIWKVEAQDTKLRNKSGVFPYIIDTTMSSYETHGTVDLTDVQRLVIGINRNLTTATTLGYIYKLETMILVYGNSSNPCSFSDGARHAQTASLRTIQAQGGQAASQFYVSQSIDIGDYGTSATYWKSSNQSMEMPAAYGVASRFVHHQIDTSRLFFTVKAGASDTIDLSNCTLNFGDFHNFVIGATCSASATYNFSGLVIIGSLVELNPIAGFDYAGATFAGCKELTTNGADLSGGCTISNTAGVQAITVTSEADLIKLYNCTFKNNSVAIKITGNQTGTWSDPNLTVTGNTYDIEYTGTTNFTIQSANTLTVNNSSSGVLTIDTPTFDLTVNSSESASQINVFTTTTQTILATEASNTQLTYTHSSETVDITVLKDGYIPYRQTGVVLSGTVTIDVQLVKSREYLSTHGLTYTTDASWASNQLTVPTWGVTGQEVFSLIMEAFKSQTALRNTAFNLQMDGANSLYLVNDAEGASDASIENLIECGVAYLNTAGTTTASWVGVKSVGTATGFTGEFQQIDGSGTTDARATGIFNQLIKMYGDITHGNFDYTDHLVLKYQPNTYRESRVDVLSSYGLASLSPTLYIVALEPLAIGITAGDPAISITIVDHTSIPLVVGGKSFDFEIQDNGANDGDAILREINYNLSLDATYQGRDPFNWPELVLLSGTSYETIYGTVEGLAGLHGVYVSRAAADHPDFTRHQSNDGTYYVKPILANGSISSIVAGSRVRIYNETTLTETYNDIPGTSYSVNYTEGTTYTAGDVISIYITQQSGVTAKLAFSTSVIASSTGWSAIAAQLDDDIYNTNAIDGSLITKFTADYVNDEIDLTTATNFTGPEVYAFYVYELTTANGITNSFGGFTALDAGNYRNNVAVVSMKLDNTTATEVWQTDTSRIFRSDSVRPVRNPTSGGGGIDVNWQNVVYVVTAGSGLTAGQAAELTAAAQASTVNTKIGTPAVTVSDDIAAVKVESAAILVDTGTDIPASIAALTAPDNASIAAIKAKTDSLTFTKSNELDANIQSVNDVTVAGTGATGDEWGP